MMKKIYLFLIFATFLSACGSEMQKSKKNDISAEGTTKKVSSEEVSNTDGVAAFAFQETTYEFGRINEGEKVTHIFRFTNEGSTPLIIQDAKGSCGCTVPEYPENPIAPGEQAEVKVVFNSTGKSGSQNKTVTLFANTDPETTILKIVGQVVPARLDNMKEMKGPLKQ